MESKCSTTNEFHCLCPHDEEFAALNKALSHPVRLTLLRTLLQDDCCCCGDFVKNLPFAQSTISQHLKVLTEEKIIEAVQVGTRTDYRVVSQTLARWVELTSALAGHSATSNLQVSQSA